MFKDRIETVRSVIRDMRADAFLVINHEYSGQPGTRYLSGFSGSESLILVTAKENFIFTDGRYFSQVKEECSDFELIPSGRSSFGELAETCKKINIKKIIFDAARTYHDSVEELNKKIAGIAITGVGNILQKIRVVKDEFELSQLKEAARIACGAFDDLLPYIKEGITEKELAWKLEVLIREYGAEKISFNLIVVSGPNGAKPHGRPSEKKLAKGELITFDFGCFYNGYASDTTRTVALGIPSDKLLEIYEIVKTAQNLACASAKAGMSGKDLDKISRDYISQRGYSDYFLHSTGHGLGMEVHELPYVVSSNTEQLPENSVITIEPGIYIEGLGGVRIKDAVILKKDGNINLSEGLPKELIIL